MCRVMLCRVDLFVRRAVLGGAVVFLFFFAPGLGWVGCRAGASSLIPSSGSSARWNSVLGLAELSEQHCGGWVVHLGTWAGKAQGGSV